MHGSSSALINLKKSYLYVFLTLAGIHGFFFWAAGSVPMANWIASSPSPVIFILIENKPVIFALFSASGLVKAIS